MISELECCPGERLVEADLARLFGVSKTPVREAFLLLEADGLVELSPYMGARVTWMSIDAYEQQQFIFDALEQPALPRVAERLSRRGIATRGGSCRCCAGCALRPQSARQQGDVEAAPGDVLGDRIPQAHEADPA